MPSPPHDVGNDGRRRRAVILVVVASLVVGAIYLQAQWVDGRLENRSEQLHADLSELWRTDGSAFLRARDAELQLAGTPPRAALEPVLEVAREHASSFVLDFGEAGDDIVLEVRLTDFGRSRCEMLTLGDSPEVEIAPVSCEGL